MTDRLTEKGLEAEASAIDKQRIIIPELLRSHGLDGALRARLALYEPPEGERDNALVCRQCGSAELAKILESWCGKDERTHWCRSHSGATKVVENWRYLASQRILNGEDHP